MTRRTDLRRQGILVEALEKARAIAESDGLEGLTARRIAADAGCSVGTLYNVFGNLDTLILHLNATTLDALHGRLASIRDIPEPEDRIRALGAEYRSFTEENPRLWDVIFEHVWPRDYELPEWYREQIQRLLALVADALEPLFPEGREAERYQAATVLWCGLHGIRSLAVTGKLGIVGAGGARELADMLIRGFLAGLGR
jgi:AcrR family transcriptional regulator